MILSLLYSDKSKKIVENIKEKFEDAETVKLYFTEIVSDGFDFQTEMKSEFWFKKPGYFKYQTEEQIMMTDLKTMWDLKIDLNQLRIDEYYPEKSKVNPNDFLISYNEESNSLYLREENGAHIIKLIPKTRLENKSNLNLEDEYTIIHVDVKTEELIKIEMHQANGNIVSYVIDKIEINAKISNSEFVFKETDGLEVIDLRF